MKEGLMNCMGLSLWVVVSSRLLGAVVRVSGV